MTKKIGLSQINNSFSGANYLPYAAGLLQAYAEAHCPVICEYEFLEPLFRRIPVSEAVAQFADADILGFSLYVWNVKLSLAIARQLKERRPEVLVVCGGPQVPDQAEGFLAENPFVDLVIHSEGEQTFCDLLALPPSRDFSGLPGVSFRAPDGTVVTTAKRDRLREIDTIPSPYLSGVFAPLMQRLPDMEWLALWETNRGCPFACTFCDWGSATQTKVLQFGMERLEKELTWFSDTKIEFIFCCDANFGILPRDVEIARIAAQRKSATGYPKALSVQNTKNATERAYLTQKILADAGLNKGVTLSMQSLSMTALTNIKRQNISLDTYDELHRRFTKDGVVTYSDLILGLPGETFDSFAEGVSILIENGQHNRIQFNNLSVLPNAEMGSGEYQKTYGMELVKSKILNMHGSFELAVDGIEETQDLVVATTAMPRADWRKTRAFAWMTALLHFDKLMQIPLILLHQITSVRYRDVISAYLDVEAGEFPLLAEIRDHFLRRAAVIQDGGPEYFYSAEWLGIWWPDDEYILVELATSQRLDLFYEEAGRLAHRILDSNGGSAFGDVLADAIRANRALIKLPFQNDAPVIELNSNVLDVYFGVTNGVVLPLEIRKTAYRIDRSKQAWSDWQSWCREVVWWGNKKGAYIYGTEALEKYYAAHY